MTADAFGPPLGLELHAELERFLYEEAALLDERRFDEWLGVLADDIHYWMPVRTTRMPREIAAEVAGPTGAAFFDDDLDHLRVRVAKLATDRSWSEAPPSRTRHLITNVRANTTAVEGTYHVRSSFLLYRTRGDRYEDILAGARTDLIRRTNDGELRIARRRILLDQSVLQANNLSVFF